MLDSILLILLGTLVIFCAAQLLQIKRNTIIDDAELKNYFNDSLNSVLLQQNKELAKSYVAEQAIASRIEMHLKEGSFDLRDFADEASQRAVVYAIEKAEANVKLAEDSLFGVKQTIASVQKTLDQELERNWQKNVELYKNTLKELTRQENILENRVDEAYSYLKELTDAIIDPKNDQPTSGN